jgi:2-aminoethylphosphonate transport system ATP-binding protein
VIPTARAVGITFDNVSVAYRGQTVLDRFSIDIHEGEIVALIGPSGSGKTTALRALAGFVKPASGRVLIGGADVTHLPPYARGLGMVVQNYALFPHLKVEDNVAFGLRAQGADKARIARRVEECLRVVGMSSFVGRYPRQLSGGQQQRVAIARALAIEPRVLLLDEPLSALDAQIRRSMVEELAKLHRDLPQLTALYVTHDQSEALTLADRIAIMRDGKLAAFGPSQALYRQPPNRFTAEFLGRANLLPVQVEAGPRNGAVTARFGETRLRVSAASNPSAGEALLCVRPHALKIADSAAAPNRLSGVVRHVLWQGDRNDVTLDCGGHVVRLVTPPVMRLPTIGEAMHVAFDPEDAALVPPAAS